MILRKIQKNNVLNSNIHVCSKAHLTPDRSSSTVPPPERIWLPARSGRASAPAGSSFSLAQIKQFFPSHPLSEIWPVSCSALSAEPPVWFFAFPSGMCRIQDLRGWIHKEWLVAADSAMNCESFVNQSVLSQGPLHKRYCTNAILAQTRSLSFAAECNFTLFCVEWAERFPVFQVFLHTCWFIMKTADNTHTQSSPQWQTNFYVGNN